MNASTHQDGFNVVLGQEVDGPPFNDCCIAVSVRCSCPCRSVRALRLDKCSDGTIPAVELVEFPEESEPPVNDGTAGNAFLFVLGWALASQ